jgi:methanethiol S-methyltransferase
MSVTQRDLTNYHHRRRPGAACWKELMTDKDWRGALSTMAATGTWAGLHSLLASGASKATAERAIGTRARNGLYRVMFNAVAVVTFARLVSHIRRQPGRTLYHVRAPASAAMRLGQLASAVYFVWGVLQVGVGGLSGLPNLVAWLRGRRQVPREPEGQTPPPPVGGSGWIMPTSPFALTRQALNVFPLPLLWLNPRMTTRLAAFNVVATAYFYLGSLHSDRRLRQRYGRPYDQAYADRGVPLFLPRLRPWRMGGVAGEIEGRRGAGTAGARKDRAAIK